MTRKLLVLGGGFGLYGYLPAALSAGWTVSTLEKYSQFIAERSELQGLRDKIEFIDERSLNFNDFQGIVIARTPDLQMHLIRENLQFTGHLFLEKPLGQDMDSHLAVTRILEKAAGTFSVGYLFRYQDWYAEVLRASSQNGPMEISWLVVRNESSSWKSNPVLGGGIISYFGVHLLSLVTDLGFSASTLRISSDSSSLSIESLDQSRPARFVVAFSDSPTFEVQLLERSFSLSSPFGPTPLMGVTDPRVDSLSKYLSQHFDANTSRIALEHESQILKLRQATVYVM